MKYKSTLTRILLILAAIYAIGTASASIFLNSFNSGQLSKDIKYRHDLERTPMGSEQLENILIRPQGMAYKRPGTEFIANEIAEITITTTTITVTGEYPTLQELTADEIPDAPDEPADTELVAATNVNDYAGLQAIGGSGHYNITGDIDLTGETWTPIANFSGVIEGNDKTISNLTITGTSDYRGLFNNLASGAEIRNLNFEDCSVTGDDQIAILAGRTDDAAEGIVIKNITMTDCTVTGDDTMGCLVGYLSQVKDSFFYDCHTVNCDVTGTGNSSWLGGMFGRAYFSAASTDEYSYVVNCSVTGGTISATSLYQSGGFAGYIRGYGTGVLRCGGVYDSFATADIESTGDSPSWLGGFAGGITCFDATSCYATGDITVTYTGADDGISAVGGFFGNGTCFHDFVNCYATGDILLDGTGTGLATIEITGEIGGFGGYLDWEDTLMRRCYATGNVELDGPFDSYYGVGGFIGAVYMGYQAGEEIRGLIERSWSSGDITISDTQATPYMLGGTGGFIGFIYCAATPDASVTIQNCYAWGSITYTDSATNVATGGFIGNIREDFTLDITIDNTYCAQTDIATGSSYTNQIPLGDYSNGFIGYWPGSEVTESFYDTDTGLSTDDYADGHITSWLQTQSNFEDAGWDFDTIWVLTETEEEGPETQVTLDVGGNPKAIRLIPFEYSTDDAYVLEFGHRYIGFLRSAQ